MACQVVVTAKILSANQQSGLAICVLLFVIASLFSIHSVRGYIALNITKSLAPMERNKDVYASLKQELSEAQTHLEPSGSQKRRPLR